MSVEFKEIVDDYVLLCFDISSKNAKLRKKVLRKIAAAGGIMFTQSSYYLPYSPENEALAEAIASDGVAVIWRAKQQHKDVAEKLTMSYEEHLHVRCQTIETRIAMIQGHIELGQLGKANRMHQKTSELLDQLTQISHTFCPAWLPLKIGKLEADLFNVYNN